MFIPIEYPKTITPEAAISLQEKLRSQVILHDDLGQINPIAGVDVGVKNNDSISCAAVTVLKYPELTLHEHQLIRLPIPYIPRFLAFREKLISVNLTRINLSNNSKTAHPSRPPAFLKLLHFYFSLIKPLIYISLSG